MKQLIAITFFAFTIIACNDKASKNKADNFKKQAQQAHESKEHAAAIDAAKEALELYTSMADTLGMVESNHLLARSSALSGDFESAVRYGEAGSNLCKIVINYPLEYKLNNILSWAYFALGKGFDETFEHQQRQLHVVEQLDDDENKAMVYNNYGYDATVAGSVPLEETIRHMKWANDYYAKTENNNGRWYTLMNLTWQHRLINDLSQSEKYGRLAVSQAEKDNDRHAIIEANTSLGETLLLQNKVEEARPLYERGLELSLQQDDRDKYVFDVYYSKYLWETQQQDTAIAMLKSAITFLEKDEIFYEMLARAFLTTFSYERKDFDEAKKQIAIFKNPRANYYSQEASVMASLVEAQILADTDKQKASEILRNQLEAVDKSGAQLLKITIKDILDTFESHDL